LEKSLETDSKHNTGQQWQGSVSHTNIPATAALALESKCLESSAAFQNTPNSHGQMIIRTQLLHQKWTSKKKK